MATTKTKKTNENLTGKFNPAKYLWSFNEAQRNAVASHTLSGLMTILTVGVTADQAMRIEYLKAGSKKLNHGWIDKDGKAFRDGKTFLEYIEASEIFYHDYLNLIAAKYPAETAADVIPEPADGMEIGDVISAKTIETIKTNPHYSEFAAGGEPEGSENLTAAEKSAAFDSFAAALAKDKPAEYPEIIPIVQNSGSRIADEIALGEIVVSPFEPQQTRRQRFRPDEFDELAISIKNQGLIHPITVRAVGGKFEIVVGERRFRATAQAGFASIAAFVKTLTDEEAFEKQMQENLQRKDLHPLDEAASYKYLIGRGGSVADLINRFGKSEGYITNRLKLNELSGIVLSAYQQDEIMFSHALELAKYPVEAQKEIFPYCFTNQGFTSQALVSVPKLVAKIEEHYLLRLSKAPFSTKSTELRADGLACVKCPERTGASPFLFEVHSGKNDCCLNRICWNGKSQMHVQIQRRTVAAARYTTSDAAVIEKNLKKIPLVSREYSVNVADKPKDGFVGKYEFTELKKESDCEYGETGVYFNGDTVGQRVALCRNAKCKKHGKQSGSSSNGSNPEKESETRLIRKEEIFDVKVGEATRLRVLKQSAENFGEDLRLFDAKKSADYEIALLTRLWELQCSFSDRTAKDICTILGIEKDRLSTSRWGSEFGAQIAALTPTERQRLMFLLLYAHEGELDPNGGTWRTQKAITALAEEFAVDYRRLDAEERLALAPMKHKDTFRAHLHSIEAGSHDAKPPRMHTDKWKPEGKN